MNLFLTIQAIQDGKKSFLTNPPKQAYCTGEYDLALGCIKEEFGISTGYAWLSIPIFIFLVFLLVIKKADKMVWILAPLLTLLWIVLTEIFIKILHIPVIHVVPLEGDLRILSTVFLGWGSREYLILTFFSLTTGFIAAFFGVLHDYAKRSFPDDARKT